MIKVKCDFCEKEGNVDNMYVLFTNDQPSAKNSRVGLRRNDLCGGCLQKVDEFLNEMMDTKSCHLQLNKELKKKKWPKSKPF